MDTVTAQKCSVCIRDAMSACKACKGTPDGIGGFTAIYYCSAACQKQDWSIHKLNCNISKDRQTLYRADGLAQRLFTTFRKTVWSWPIDKVEIGKGRIYWVDVGMDHTGDILRIFDAQRRPRQHEKHYLFPFPIDQFPDVRQQQAILMMDCCGSAIYAVDNLLSDMLKGWYPPLSPKSLTSTPFTPFTGS